MAVKEFTEERSDTLRGKERGINYAWAFELAVKKRREATDHIEKEKVVAGEMGTVHLRAITR